MARNKGASVPFLFALANRQTRAEGYLQAALQAFSRGAVGDALVFAECAARQQPGSAIPALLVAKILDSCRKDLALKAWFRAWKREPELPAAQDSLLNAWQSAGASDAVRAVGAAVLPQRVRAGNHHTVLAALRRAGLTNTGCCWLAHGGVDVAIFDLTQQGQQDLALVRVCRGDERGANAPAYECVIPMNAGCVHVPLPDLAPGPWVLQWRPVETGASTPYRLMQGSPLVIPAEFSDADHPRALAQTPQPMEVVVDIVIPVYGDPDGVKACVRSVLDSQSQNTTMTEVVVVNDASPHAELLAHLQALAGQGRITLLSNPFNLGFIEAANRGLRLHPRRDVIMLNADTLVQGNWVDRLARALHASADIASVAPWSNNGELSNFPRLRQPSLMPRGDDLAQLDQLVAGLHASGRIADQDLLSNCGFAMMMKRQVIERIGVFDGVGLTRGYGEDTDWCLRAREAGFRHCLAVGVFVAHGGTASFGYEKTLRVRQNRAVLHARFPEYEAEYHRFLRLDPLQSLRQDIWRVVCKEQPAWAGLVEGRWAQPAHQFAGMELALPGCSPRIAVWAYKPNLPSAGRVLQLARSLAKRQLGVRVLLVGEAEDALWHTGVVDVLSPGTLEDQRVLADEMVLALAGCQVWLTQEPCTDGLDARAVLLDEGFDPEVWLDQWLDEYGFEQAA